MLSKLKEVCRDAKYKIFSFFIITIGLNLLTAILKTCTITITGLDKFCKVAKEEKAMLMLWHNRLSLVPFILSKYAPNFIYSAVVSNSRDGRLLKEVVLSYKAGRSIQVPHHARHQAMREIIQHIEQNHIVIMTPDGPRGPKYQIKPGIAMAAIATKAFIFPFYWEADRYWELKTWDQFRIPKPFSKIEVIFKEPVCFKDSIERDAALKTLQEHMPKN